MEQKAGCATASPMVGQRAQNFYYAAFAVLCFWREMALTEFSNSQWFSFSCCSYVAMAIILFLLLARVVFGREAYEIRTAVLAALAVLLSGISALLAGETMLFFTTCFVVLARDVEIKRLAQISLGVSIAVVVICLAGLFAGLIGDVTVYRASHGMVRHSLGFRHPNSFALAMLQIQISFMVIKWPRVNFSSAVATLATIALAVFIADSRTVAFVSAASFAAMLIAKVPGSDLERDALTRIGMLLGLIAMAVSIFAMVVYSETTPFLPELDKLLSGRIWYAHAYWETYPHTLLGYNFDTAPQLVVTASSSTACLVDNAFCRLLLRYGIIPFACVFAAMVGITGRKCANDDMYLAYVVLVVMFALGISERFFFDYSINYGLLALSQLLWVSPTSTSKPLTTGIIGRRLLVDSDEAFSR